MIDNNTGKPFINIWFGNFYRPAYDDKLYIDSMMKELSDLGFGSIMLDTKAWEDFKDRFETGNLSPYVEMQEYMQISAADQGLTHNFLTLYLNGDNLYPRIRFSPPIFGEEVINRQGKPGRWYKYWSEIAQQSMVDHVKRVITRYKNNHTLCCAEGRNILPMCSMWDPVVSMSFDEDGCRRYLGYLTKIYDGDIQKFNAAYQSDFGSFDELKPEDYWFTYQYDKSIPFDADDVKEGSPRFYMWRDNQRWKMEELILYFKKMNGKLHAIDSGLFLMPAMTQWGYFLNIDGNNLTDQDADFSDLWDTSVRGVDIYALAPYVDCCHFITIPVRPNGTPDAYVSSYQHSMMRIMNEGRSLIGGIYWGRFLYQDIYQFITPCEIIGSMAAAGIDGYSSYGVNGLDDGGVLNRMDQEFLESLKTGNEWLARVIKKRKGMRKKQIALLFPSAMAGLETFETEGNKIRRLDSLGWYELLCDMGYQVDVIDPGVIEQDRLNDYQILIIPADDCYFRCRNIKAESGLKAWIESGGIVVHGPQDGWMQDLFDFGETECEKEPYVYDEAIIPQGISFSSYSSGKCIASYVESGKACTVSHQIGKGIVYSLGIQIGASYVAENIPHVPYEQKNSEMYPFVLSNTNMIKDILSPHIKPLLPVSGKNLEIGIFENGYFIVNHRAVPFTLQNLPQGKYDFQYDIDGNTLLPHSSVWICPNAK